MTDEDDARPGLKPIEIYTSPLCGFCFRAKGLLEARGYPFKEIDVLRAPGAKAEMIARADGRRTVPQIFIDGVGVGGSDELAALDASGALARLVEGP